VTFSLCEAGSFLTDVSSFSGARQNHINCLPNDSCYTYNMHLPDTEQKITTLVVRRFAEARMPTTRKEIVVNFKPHGPDTIHRLLAVNVLRTLEPDQLIPSVVAFHLCGWTDARHKAKSSFEMVASVLQRIYEITPEAIVLTTEVLKADMEQRWPNVNPIVMWLGLYQCFEMGFVGGWAWEKQAAEVQALRINEGIMSIDAPKYWGEYIRKQSNRVELSFRQHNSRAFLQGISDLAEGHEGVGVAPTQWVELANRLGLAKEDRDWIVRQLIAEGSIQRKPASDLLALTRAATLRTQTYSVDLEEPDEMTPPSRSRKVFLVHGHDEAVKERVARFLEKLSLDVVILHEQPNRGRTIIEKFEDHSDVGYAVVLLTPDDICGPVTESPSSSKRARQNVVLELGYFFAKLGRERVCAVYVGEVELPSDIHGLLFVPYDREGAWKLKLAQEIKAAGIEVDLNSAIP
jgi:predicted nucleotide-binding protein